MNYTIPFNAKTALTYDDITLVPQYSEVESRQKINLETQLTTNYKLMVPLIASPMDTICEIEMALEMMHLGGVGIIHRFMSIETQALMVADISDIVNKEGFAGAYNTGRLYEVWNTTIPVAAAIGANGDYLERAQELTKAGANVILIDVAHGHHVFVRDAIENLKKNLPLHVDIIAGNVATAQGAVDLEDWGADAIRVGIGGGCFTPNMKVGTTEGTKPIVDVQVDDVVYTHTGEPKEVIHKFEYDRDEEIMVINGIECTKNHEFYVIHKRHLEEIVDDESIHVYAKWIPAEELTDQYYLVDLD